MLVRQKFCLFTTGRVGWTKVLSVGQKFCRFTTGRGGPTLAVSLHHPPCLSDTCRVASLPRLLGASPLFSEGAEDGSQCLWRLLQVDISPIGELVVSRTSPYADPFDTLFGA